MTIERQNPGDVVLSVSLYRDGERLENADGEYELREFIRGFEIYESINSSTLESKIIIEDSAGLINILTGTELFRIQVKGSIIDRTFYMRSYNIESRSRTNQGSDVYIVNLVTDEFIKNEATNIFGNTRTVFNNKTETSQIVSTILKDNRFSRLQASFEVFKISRFSLSKS